jgi:hypothetical protein
MPGLTFRISLITAGLVVSRYSHSPACRLVSRSSGSSRTRSTTSAATLVVQPILLIVGGSNQEKPPRPEDARPKAG